MGMFLLSILTAERIPGKAGMATVMCVELQVAGPARIALLVSRDILRYKSLSGQRRDQLPL